MLTNRLSRIKYNFSQDFFHPDGHVVFSDLTAARSFASQMSALQNIAIPASDLYAISLLDEAYHILLKHFHSRYTGVMARAMANLQSNLGSKYELALTKFTEEFPPKAVYRGEVSAGTYLSTRLPNAGDFGRGVRFAAIEEMMVVQNANNNPAIKPYLDLFDDTSLKSTPYQEVLTLLQNFFSNQPGLSDGESLYDILFGAIQASPDSLEGQLLFVLEKWGRFLGPEFSERILRGLDYIKEDVIRKQTQSDSLTATESIATNFSSEEYAEGERYSPDQAWMPSLVLLAKNTYVWLAQLSKKYGREIKYLNEIPDEELDLLKSRGFTGLWLIGLWERSKASQKIKQRMGQGDAVASAYSLYSYDIATDLGGWSALENLRARAWERGIRLSADMVPNHMGIDSQWVIEHPDWFLSSPFPPYSSYSFKSENLSDDLRVSIHLEDHYYDRTDAAVVFQRRDLQTGDLRYIYHGNDGTSFPWNDTAQLDYTNPEVREAVIQVILHVARNFPIIRFDAAMTLAKKHIQRLWFPEPGAGGAIPSRAQFGLSKAEFDEKVPHEFWREVVDRVAQEVPDTLLLAEAFWLMEGYFVRTLGMHRVYNSAFMHMLRDEDNAKYRMSIKNTLEFDPQILKRFVNFMNNPDEKTAIEQFGNGDKYFGICTLLATLPGLPMFGHGQVEGFSEKYGMEFRRPKMHENQDDDLIQAHQWRIFPLLHRRRLFADVEHFLFFDFNLLSGGKDENVFAYSNRLDDERGLIIYHNKFGDTRGWIKNSLPSLDKSSGRLKRSQLAEGLNLPKSGYVIFKDYASQLEYIRSCREIWEQGLYVELGAYQCHAFMDFRFVNSNEWANLHDTLNGSGVKSMDEKWVEMFGSKEEIRQKAIAKKVVTKKKAVSKKKKSEGKTSKVVKKKPAVKKTASKKVAVKKTAAKKSSTAKKEVKKPSAVKKKEVKKSTPAKKSTPQSKSKKAVKKKK